MKRIEMEKWEPVPNETHKTKYAGQRTGQEVFAELRHRLESTGYLPDEYFSLGDYWKNGIEIPKDAELFCTADYGSSEGIYLDIGLRWFEEGQEKPTLKSLATGKTLGETSADLDRMHLIASAVIKAFHSDDVHAKYMRLGDPEKAVDSVIHLNGKEQRLLIDSLVDRRRYLRDETMEVEQLLRRVTGSVLEFINEVGMRPMRISAYDRAVLAIQDGDFNTLGEAHYNVPSRTGDLLPLAAGRPGKVGFQMTGTLLVDAKDIPQEQYLAACKNAVAAGDKDRVLMLTIHAEECVKDLDMGIYGKVISAALDEHHHIAKAVMDQYTQEQLRAADPYLMAQVVGKGDLNMARKLAGSGIDVNSHAAEIIRALTWNSDNRFFFKYLLEAGMQIGNGNFAAMHACINTKNPEAAKLLIDQGMDFDAFKEWAAEHVNIKDMGTFNAVTEHWESRKQELAQEPDLTQEPEQAQDLTMGGI